MEQSFPANRIYCNNKKHPLILLWFACVDRIFMNSSFFWLVPKRHSRIVDASIFERRKNREKLNIRFPPK